MTFKNNRTMTFADFLKQDKVLHIPCSDTKKIHVFC
ncbi:hypothetical protein CP8484711_0544, partial [Chlamydia psittaci 84-8471/1]